MAMYGLFFLATIISGSASQDAIYRNICDSLIENFDCSHGFKSQKLCGTDGSIYETECDFALAHCRDVTLQVQPSSASCDGSSVVSGSVGSAVMTTKRLVHSTTSTAVTTPTTATTAGVVPTTLSPMCKVLVSTKCPDTKKEICGSDKETYDNACKYGITKCHNPTLTIEHPGACKLTAVDVICKAVKNRPCPGEREILCGSDGITYSNLYVTSCTHKLYVTSGTHKLYKTDIRI